MEVAQHSSVLVQHLENVSLIIFGVYLVTMEMEITAKWLRLNNSNKRKHTPIENYIILSGSFELNAKSVWGYISSLAYLMRKQITIFLPDAHENTLLNIQAETLLR